MRRRRQLWSQALLPDICSALQSDRNNFNLNGIGQYAVQSITMADYAPIQGFVLVAAVSR